MSKGKVWGEGSEYFFTPDGEAVIQLDDTNLVAAAHREEPLYDLIQLQDPTDEQWWSWWRFSSNEREFNALINVAERVGHVVLRSTASPELLEAFHEKHRLEQFTHADLVALSDEDAEVFTDADFERLLDD